MSESHALEELLEANGIAPEQFPAVASSVTHLEMFLHHYPRMEALNHFPALKTLALIHQELKVIEGLEGCPLLEKLWLQENEISVIQGLDSLHRLKELYLYSNHISEIRGLNKLTQLEVVWLSDNYISRIAGLGHLPVLRELHLARNDIAFLGDGLSACTALTHLNLADNKIGSFKELRALASLPRLVDLCFSDPMWGDCPLAQLCNYQTFVLFVMPHLTSLDTLLLADEAKALAEATFLKKQMYYNMRVKTLRRNARQIVKLAAEGRLARQALRQPLKNTLVLAAKDLDREIYDLKQAIVAAAAVGGSGDAAATSTTQADGTAAATTSSSPSSAQQQHVVALESKLAAITAHLARYSAAEAELEAAFEAASERTYSLLSGLVARMMSELDTAGNIRLEDARPTDMWYPSCLDLVATRFNASDFPTSLGISGLRVTGVTRIHNRWLRSRFDAALAAQQVDTSDPAHKRNMEYLLLGEHPGLPGLLDMAVEDGLPEPEQLAAQGLDGAVVVASSVFLADRLRLAAALDPGASAATAEKAGGGGVAAAHASAAGPGAAAVAGGRRRGTGPNGGVGSEGNRACGRLMVVRAFLGRTAHDLSVSISGTLPSKFYGKDGKLSYSAMVEGGSRIMASAWPDTDAVYRVRSGDMKQKLWYVFNNVLVLPEYIVEYTYDVLATSPLAPQPSLSPVLASAAAATAITTAGGGAAATTASGGSSSSGGSSLMAMDLQMCAGIGASSGASAAASGFIAQSAATHQAILDSLDPDIRPLARPMLGWLALQADPSLLRCGLVAEEEEAQRLVAAPPPIQPCNKIYRLTEEAMNKAVGGIPLNNVVRLDLHNSGLRKMESLAGMRHLQVLVLCYNELSRLEGLEGLVQLRTLDLGHNSIRKVEASLKGLYNLTQLDLSSNQVLKLEELYNMKKYSPQLVVLDLRDNPICNDKAYRSTTLRKLKRLERFDGRPVSAEEKERFGEHAGAVTLPMVLEHGSVASRGSDSLGDAARPNDPGSITDLTLERMHIRRLQQLAGLTSLRRASLADNEISSLEGIEGCRALEELSLEANRVSSLVGLGGLTRIRKLQLGQNRLASLDALTGLTGLVQLSVEDNELATLAGAERLTNLLELYAGNNRISELREVQRLRDMPKLIILDLAGNPLAGSLASAAAAAAAAAAANVTAVTAGGGGASSAAAVTAGSGGAAAVSVGPSGAQAGAGASVAAAAAAAAVSDDYRLYVIFQVRKLKVLDGVAVTAIEQAAAKNKYAGRLTADFLEERLGHRLFDRIRDLDCSGLRIRDVGVVFLMEDLEGLQELNLDNNLLTEVSALALLRNLVVLRLNNNRLGEECSFIPARMLERNVDLMRALAARQQAAGLPLGSYLQLDAFPSLQVLQLGGNQVSSISSLQLNTLTGLRSLFLQANDITRIEGLDGLVNLQELVLDRNRIRYIDMDALNGLPRLRELRLEENGLRSLHGFHPVSRSLQALHVGSNRISEPADLERLIALTGLLELTLAGNPISRKNAYRAMVMAKCPRLQVLDQQMVTGEERDYAEQLFAPQAQVGMAMGMTMVPQSGVPTFVPLMPGMASPGAPTEAMLAAMAASAAAGGGGQVSNPGLPGGPGKQPIKMTNIDFSGMANSAPPSFPPGPQPGTAGSVPSIQSNTLVLTGAASFGLEGVGIGSGVPGGGGPAGVWPGMANGSQIGSRGVPGRGGAMAMAMAGNAGNAAGLALAGRGTAASPMSGSSPLRKGPGPAPGRSPGGYK